MVLDSGTKYTNRKEITRLKHTIAHIINPFRASSTSDLNYAQPVTFETMKKAREIADQVVSIELLAACFPEDQQMVPAGFKSTSYLERSVLDHHKFEKKIKLPLLNEII